MNTLDLFLKNAEGEHVEAVHQRILWWLFHSSAIIKEILNEDIHAPDVQMETYIQTYDLQINDGTKEALLVELKMWSTLTEKQINKQIDKRIKGAKLVYILFGISYLERKDFLEDKNQPILKDIEVKVIGADDLSKSLMKLSDKTNSIVEELNNNTKSECTSIELKNFLRTYALRLSRVNDWFINEAYQEKINDKNRAKVYASLFNQVKIRIEGKDRQCFIYRSNQSSVKLEITSPEIRQKKDNEFIRNRELKIEGIEGKLAFWLINDKVKIVFIAKEPQKENSKWENVIREKFDEKVNGTMLHKGNTLKDLKSTTKYVTVWSKTYSERNPDEIVGLIKIYYPLYLNRYNSLKNQSKS